MEIFDTVKHLCDKKNVKISVLERDLGFSRGSIYKMADSAPSSDKLKKLADYFNVSADFLLGRAINETEFNTNNTTDMTFDAFLENYELNKGKLTSEEKLKLAQKILSDINN